MTADAVHCFPKSNTNDAAPEHRTPRKEGHAISPEIRAAIEAVVKRHYVDPNAESFSIEAFCARYGIGRQLAYDEINAGRLIAIKRGRRTLIRRIDAERWLATAPPFEPRAQPKHQE